VRDRLTRPMELPLKKIVEERQAVKRQPDERKEAQKGRRRDLYFRGTHYFTGRRFVQKVLLHRRLIAAEHAVCAPATEPDFNEMVRMLQIEKAWRLCTAPRASVHSYSINR